MLGALTFAGAAVASPAPNSVIATIPIEPGAEPQTLAVDPVTHQVFEVSFFGVLKVIDQSTNTVTATIDLGPGYWVGLALDPETGKVFVASETYDNHSAIDVISVSTDKIIDSIVSRNGSNPNDPHAIAVDPDTHTVYIAEYCEPACSQGSVSVMNESTYAITSTVLVGPEPQDVVIDPARHQAFVTNYGSWAPGGGTVTVISTLTNTVTATIPVGQYPWGESVDPVTGRVYVANVFGYSLSVIDEGTDTVTATIPVPGTQRALYVTADPVSGQVYVPVGDAIGVISELTNTVVAKIIGVPSPGPGAADPLSGLFYIGSRGGASEPANVSVIEPAAG